MGMSLEGRWRAPRWRRAMVWVMGVCGMAGISRTGLGLDAAPTQRMEAPTQRMERMSYLAGGVTVERSDNTGRDPAQLNMPLPEGSRVVTAGDGQAEMEFEDGSLLRMAPNSSVTLTSLRVDGSGNFLTRVDVGRGLVYAELRAAARFQYLIEIGGDAISPVTNATFRMEFDQPPAVVAVLDGSVHVANGVDGGGTAGFNTELRAGESLSNDEADASRYLLSEKVKRDAWDSWNEDRDRAAGAEAMARTSARDGFAGDQGYGWSDLDANGSWYDVAGQGEVWQPSMAAIGAAGAGARFDPYGYGSWVWYPAAGYVWSSGYSWGWTPYRCGSWNYFNSFGWGWSPGSACGVGGGWWPGRGGPGRSPGSPINIAQGPTNYRPPRPPTPGPVKVHPVVPVNLGGLHDGSIAPGAIHDGSISPGMLHDGSLTNGALASGVGGSGGLALDGLGEGFTGSIRGTRTIAGQTVTPLAPLGAATMLRGGGVVGSSLRRDFPVDRVSRQPLMGVEAERSAAVVPGAGAVLVSPGVGNWRMGYARGGSGAGIPLGLPRTGSPMRMSPPPTSMPAMRGPAVMPMRPMAPAPAAHPAAAGGHR